MAGFVGGTSLEGNDFAASGDFYILSNPISKSTVGAEAAVGLGAGFMFFFV